MTILSEQVGNDHVVRAGRCQVVTMLGMLSEQVCMYVCMQSPGLASRGMTPNKHRRRGHRLSVSRRAHPLRGVGRDRTTATS